MKNTKFRKRALLSSVAMLLVALVALGSATFAWFTSSTTATADQLSVKTVKASELELSKHNGDWADQIHYGVANRVLKPASSADGTHWFAANADDKSSYAADNTTITDISTQVTMGSNNSYVFFDQLNIRNKGAAAVDHVTISFSVTETEAASGKYLRLALVPASARGTTATITAANFAANVYGSAADTANPLIATTGTVVSSTAITAKNGANVSIDIGSLTASTGATPAKYYNLYVWFEGQDEDCKDANAGNDMPEITFSVTGATAEQ